MKNLIFNYISIAFIGLIAIFTFNACEEETVDCPDDVRTNQTIDILPLGDSRVDGDRPSYESYRYELWKHLTAEGLDFNFMGSRKDRAQYPQFQNDCFDQDHEGTGGATSQDILKTLQSTTFNQAPEFVLLGIGGNDLLEERQVPAIISDINKIIDKLQGDYPNTIIILEQIAPGISSMMTAELTASFNSFNQEILKVAEKQSDNSTKVIAVNMAEGWQDNYMADDVHYNETGAKIVADRYFQLIKANLIP